VSSTNACAAGHNGRRAYAGERSVETGDLKKRASSAILWQYDESGRPADLPPEKALRGRRWCRRSGRGREPLSA